MSSDFDRLVEEPDLEEELGTTSTGFGRVPPFSAGWRAKCVSSLVVEEVLGRIFIFQTPHSIRPACARMPYFIRRTIYLTDFNIFPVCSSDIDAKNPERSIGAISEHFGLRSPLGKRIGKCTCVESA